MTGTQFRTTVCKLANESYLKDVLVGPVGVLRLHDKGLHVVPPVEEDAQRQQRRVLVHARVAKN